MSDLAQKLAQIQMAQARARAAEAAQAAAVRREDDQLQIERMQQFYTDRATGLGFSAEGAGWESAEMQDVRFRVLAAALLAEGSLLDVGCGQGHLFEFLRRCGRSFDYTGMDINDANLAIARSRFPDGNFVHGDVSSLEADQRYDFVVASGVFNVRRYDDPARQLALVTDAIGRMYAAARKGVVLNLLSVFAPPSVRAFPVLALYDPLPILRRCLELSYYVEYKHTYLPHDFTVYLYRCPEFDALHAAGGPG